jgi:alanyl-tRNA synthetase
MRTESAVAAGVRRIEAISSSQAMQWLNETVKNLDEIKSIVKSTGDVVKAVSATYEENSALKKQLEALQLEKLISVKKDLIARAKQAKGLNLIIGEVEVPNAELLKTLAFEIRKDTENLYLVLGCIIAGKPNLLIMLSDNVVSDKGLNASKLVRDFAAEIKGGGGGQPFFATAGGKDALGLGSALNKAAMFIDSLED